MFDTKNVEVKAMAPVMMRIRKDQRSQDKQGSICFWAAGKHCRCQSGKDVGREWKWETIRSLFHNLRIAQLVRRVLYTLSHFIRPNADGIMAN
jgi:hypothetical protein